MPYLSRDHESEFYNISDAPLIKRNKGFSWKKGSSVPTTMLVFGTEEFEKIFNTHLKPGEQIRISAMLPVINVDGKEAAK